MNQYILKKIGKRFRKSNKTIRQGIEQMSKVFKDVNQVENITKP